MAGQMPTDLNPSHEIDYLMDYMTPSRSLIRQASLPVNIAVQPHQHESKGRNGCDRCSGFWRTHSECIVRASVEGAGQRIRAQLMKSYDDLSLHIHEHTFSSCGRCSLCEDLFCYHILQFPLLFEAKSGEVGLGLGNSLMNLRKHVKEAHGGV